MQSNSAGLLNRAQNAHAAGKLASAIPLYEQLVRAEPRNFAAHYYLGIAYYQAGQLERSVPFLKVAADLRPAAIEAHKDLGLILLRLKDYGPAETSLAQALKLQPGNPDLLVNRGIALKGLGRTGDAVSCYRKAIALRPAFAEAHHNLGNGLLAVGAQEEALVAFERAASLKPQYWEALLGMGQALLALERGADAAAALKRAVSVNPRAADAHQALGVALLRQGKNEEGMAALHQALAIDPTHVAALVAQGAALEQEGRLDGALASYDAALATNPGLDDALLGRAGVLRQLRRYDEAINAYDRAIAAAPERVEGYRGAAIAFYRKREFAAAARSFDAAIKRDGTVAELHFLRGQALKEIGFLADALVAANDAIALNAAYTDAYVLKARLLSELHQSEEGIAALEKARELDPGNDRTFGLLFGEKMRIGDWRSYDEDIAQILPRIASGVEIVDPFLALSHFDSPAVQLRCAEIYAADILDRSLPPRRMNLALRDDRIAIGYYSGDFRDHAMMYLMAELFERHDSSRFRIHAFSLTKAPDSAMRKRVMPFFDDFHDVDEMSDREIIALSRAEEIDIAVDLMAYTRHGRPSLFAAGLAPLQVNYLGYPGTMGLSGVDYIVADPVLIPEEARPFYSEKVAYLPNSYQPNDGQREIAAKSFTRAELGLPDESFVYCCFNNSLKITPPVFESWMRILRQVPHSVLWLLSYTPAVEGNLRRAAEAQGVGGERLVFAKLADTPEHIARQRAADLFLDTLPYNAHTTASDALWAGLPVLTLMGQSFTSRVAGSLLAAAGIPEMIAPSREAYERMAVMFAEDRAALAAVRATLQANRLSCALFDCERYARDLETLFTQMIERHRNGLPPDHLFACEMGTVRDQAALV
ncbi:tetratricopeptide repeat protein [Aestuariivirga sp.]|uniref:O-linked N-acetylglucosamine transferase family protein n=1 Tax=Aestuariivirga sp. TaxID=2650926 RepID=UPI003BAD61FD